MIKIKTIKELYDDILADFQVEFGSNIPSFGKNFLRVLAGVQAAKLKLFYLSIGSLQKNIFIDTADPEDLGGTLERFGRVKLGRNPFPARAGQYTVEITGSIGAVITASTTFKSNDDSLNPGKLFVLDNDHILTGTTDTITVRALEAGLESKLLVNDILTATAPIALVNRFATVTTEAIEPLGEEDIEDYRRKGIDAYRLEPQGGSATDYRLWASDAQGVRQTYPYAKSGFPNEVSLFVEANILDSTDGKGTPSAGLLAQVEAVIELDPDTTKPVNERGRRPLGVFQVHYLPVTVKNIDIQITGFVGLNATIQASILNALKTLTDGIRPFISGADILDEKNDILDVNRIISTILTVRPGSTFGAVTIEVDGAPFSSYTFLNGDIPYLNQVNYV